MSPMNVPIEPVGPGAAVSGHLWHGRHGGGGGGQGGGCSSPLLWPRTCATSLRLATSASQIASFPRSASADVSALPLSCAAAFSLRRSGKRGWMGPVVDGASGEGGGWMGPAEKVAGGWGQWHRQ